MPYKSISELPSSVRNSLPPAAQGQMNKTFLGTYRKPDKELLVTLYWNDELSYSQIGDMFGCYPGAVRYWFRKLSIPARSIKEANLLARRREREERIRNPPSKITDKAGYVYVWTPNKGYVREHRLVWETERGEIPVRHLIHHINGIKSDNRIENLACIKISEHNTLTLLHIYQDRIKFLEDRIGTLEDGVNAL